MKILTKDLIGKPLDWAVATSQELEPIPNQPAGFFYWGGQSGSYSPSTDWAQGDPIIERECIALKAYATEPVHWEAGTFGSFKGATPLIAAMRCLVASKFGDEVEIPEELL